MSDTRRAMRGGRLRRLIHVAVFGLVGAVVLAMLALASGLHVFHRLTAESLVAELRFEPVGDQRWRAVLVTGDHCRIETLVLRGDQWRLDAEFLKWKYGATLLGLDALYRLDRLEGRYRDPSVQRGQPPSVHPLGDGSRPSARFWLGLLLDATYGSSVYADIDPARRYRVYRTQTGLITRSEPLSRSSNRAEEGLPLVIEIERSCRRAGPWWLGHVARLPDPGRTA